MKQEQSQRNNGSQCFVWYDHEFPLPCQPGDFTSYSLWLFLPFIRGVAKLVLVSSELFMFCVTLSVLFLHVSMRFMVESNRLMPFSYRPFLISIRGLSFPRRLQQIHNSGLEDPSNIIWFGRGRTMTGLCNLQALYIFW